MCRSDAQGVSLALNLRMGKIRLLSVYLRQVFSVRYPMVGVWTRASLAVLGDARSLRT